MRSILESWIFEASASGLPAWKRQLLKLALRHDAQLRATALDLAVFLREERPSPALEHSKATDLQRRIQAAAHRQANDEKLGMVRIERAEHRGISSGFTAALAGTALVLLVLVLFNIRSHGPKVDGGEAGLKTDALVLPTPAPTTKPVETIVAHVSLTPAATPTVTPPAPAATETPTGPLNF